VLKIILTIAFILAGAIASIGQKTKAPELALRDIRGQTVRLSDLRGKVVLLNFWATWCVPCAAEVPELVKWQTEYSDKGLQIIGITYPPTNAAAVRRFARKNKMNYPVLFGTKATKKLFDPSDNLPITMIIDKDGTIRGKIDGIIFQDEFDAKVKPLLTNKSRP
jgi:peroxiredoxin